MYAHCANARVSKKFKSTKINYAQLDGNYNPISTNQPPSTTSNELTPNEKDNDDYDVDLMIHQHHDSDDTLHFNAPPKSSQTITSVHKYERTPSTSNALMIRTSVCNNANSLWHLMVFHQSIHQDQLPMHQISVMIIKNIWSR